MPNGYIVPGQAVESQTEDKFTAAQFVVGKSPTGGGKLKICSVPIGPTALASIGTNTTDIAGQWWLTDIFITFNRTITKIGFLQGGTATTDKTMVAIWDSFGNLVGSSAVAGVTLSGANTFQEQSLVLDATGATVTSLKLLGPQQYFIGVQGNGTAAGAIQTVKAATYIDVLGDVLAGTFGTVPATITPPTTWTADKGPIVYVL
jgi:hypothetical protein